MKYKVANKYKPFLYIVDFLGNSFFFWKKFKKLNKTKVKKIAVIRLDHIGDCILTFLFFENLKKSFPGAEINVITRQSNKEILELNESIDKILTLNPPWFNREKNSYFELLKFIKNNYKKFDLVLELHSDPRNILLASLISRYSAGYGIRGFGFLLNKIVKYSEEKRHIIQRNLDVLEGIGIPAKFLYPEISLNEKEIVESKNLILNNLLKPKIQNPKLICISPGAGRKDKYWLNERWIELCNKLIENYGATIVFTGDKNEEHNISEIKNKINSNEYIDLCSKTDLKQLCAVIKNCKLVISPDSAPIHIAKALSVPSIALFNKEDPFVWGYDDNRNISIFKKGIQNIEVNDVISKIDEFELL